MIGFWDWLALFLTAGGGYTIGRFVNRYVHDPLHTEPGVCCPACDATNQQWLRR